MLTLWVPLNPVAKGRPRARLRGGRVQTYTPRPTVEAEQKIRRYVRAQLPETFTPMPADGPVSVRIQAYLRPPQRRTRWSPRQDVDNLAKLLLDALNGVCWEDDSAITWLAVGKAYAEGGAQPGWLVEVWHD